MPALNLNNCSSAFRNIILNKKHNLEYVYGLNGDSSIHTEPAPHYEPSLASPNVPFLTDYHPKLLDYTKDLDIWGSTDGYSGNVRRGNYKNQWDKRGDVINVADPHKQINEPSNEIREQWDDPIRNEYNSYLDYTNAIFMKDTDPRNVLAGILTGQGIGLSTYGGELSVVSDFDIQQTLAGRIYSTATGRDTRLGKIGMKCAAVSMANNILRKTSKMAGGVVHESLDWILNKISKGKLGDGDFNLSKYASPSITDAPGSVDNFLSSTGIGGVLNTAAGGLGLDELLAGNNWTKTATVHNDGKYVRIDVDGVLVDYKDIKPNFDRYILGNNVVIGREQIAGQDTKTKKDDVYQDIFGNESEYRRLQQSELIKWTGVINAEQIYQNLSRNIYQPGYTINHKTGKKLEYGDYNQQLSEIGYSPDINNPFDIGLKRNEGILQVENEIRIKNRRQIYTWFDQDNGSHPNKSHVSQENAEHGDAVYHGIDENNITFFNNAGVNNPNTLLAKTKKLFENGKIKTMISSFHRLDSPSEIQTAVSEYGISRGRNLVNPQRNAGATPNRYMDPYCRVWTWERQYRNVQNAIRPFLSDSPMDDPGNVGNPIKLIDLHGKIEYARPNLEEFARFTSLQDNGLPKIAPYKSDFVSYDGDGKVTSGWKGTVEDRRKYNRNYFFSIENLAWKDIPLEDVLCPSQIGPNGGRIYWFSPLNLDFSESTNVELNRESFIGRGEPVLTYVNSVRSGNLSFTMVVDHSSFMEYMKYREFNNGDEDYHGILLWDAGCDDPAGIEFNNIYKGKTCRGGEGSGCPETNEEVPPEEEINPEQPTPPVRTPPEPEKGEKGTGNTEKVLITRVYYPNDYSGIDESSGRASMDFIHHGGMKNQGYEMNTQFSLSGVNTSNLSMMNGNFFVENIKCGQTDAYIKEKKLFDLFLENITKTDLLYVPGRSGRNGRDANYIKTQGGLDSHIKSNTNPNPVISKREYLPRYRYRSYMSYWDVENHNLNINKPPEPNSISFSDFYDKCTSRDAELLKLLQEAEKVIVTGNASSHGYGATDNLVLAQNRADTMLKFIQETMGLDTSDTEKWVTETDNANVSTSSTCSSDKSAKMGRFAKVEIIKEIKEEYIINQAEIDKYEDEFEVEMDAYEKSIIERQAEVDAAAEARQMEMENNEKKKYNVVLKGRYDEEMEYYKYVDKNTDLTWSNIKDKYNHFIPGFWSLTPEGFNSRLTFLNQCTRQGPTISYTDKDSTNASNLAFGRPPVCILRIGDFVQSRIYIENISFDFKNSGQIQWDLNPEGIGPQPMMVNVNMSFIYMGGQDLSGPIAQLQNAVTFNYYANTSVYDDRASTNGMEDTLPQTLFNPYEYKNGNDYKAYLGVPDDKTDEIPNPPSETITEQTIKATDDVASRVMIPLSPPSIKNLTSPNTPPTTFDYTSPGGKTYKSELEYLRNRDDIA